ncbi:MAG: type III-B CRISPR-associated protein Cas10/Cmr2 [Bacteroidota bacterium]
MDRTSLLLVTLGPVQGFIAAGRRTADLWAGSEMLSHLAGTAIEAVESEGHPVEFLFPFRGAETSSPADPEGAASLPNRFLAHVPESEVKRLAVTAQTAVREELRKIARYALKQVGLRESHAHEAEAVAQYVEVAWVGLPEDSASSYDTLYRRVEALGGARKALRSFEGAPGTDDADGAWPSGESGHRCTLIPTLPALVPTPQATPSEVRNFWRSDVAVASKGRIRPSERLSGVALAKRYFPDYLRELLRLPASETEAFPSTSSFAAADFVHAVMASADENVRHAASGYEAIIGSLPRKVRRRYTESAIPALRIASRESPGQLYRRSGRLLIGDELTADEVEKELGPVPDHEGATLTEYLECLAQRRGALLLAAEAAGIRPPSRYYGVLVLDGDHMGRWLSGEIGRDAFGGKVGAERHREISRRLQAFARDTVPPLVEGYETEGKPAGLGRLVYGGGDDVVALLSFETALQAAVAIQEAFRTVLPDATASAGLVFAHHLTPLQQVLDAARVAEKTAKDTGRNRITITALKRSGTPASLTLKWSALSGAQAFSKLIRENRVASGFAYDVEDLIRRLSAPPPIGRPHEERHIPEFLHGPFREEVRRLFGRRMPETASSEAQAEAYEESVAALLGPVRPARLAGALHVAQLLGKGGDR